MRPASCGLRVSCDRVNGIQAVALMLTVFFTEDNNNNWEAQSRHNILSHEDGSSGLQRTEESSKQRLNQSKLTSFIRN